MLTVIFLDLPDLLGHLYCRDLHGMGIMGIPWGGSYVAGFPLGWKVKTDVA